MRKLQNTLIFAGLVAACLMAGCKKENPSQGTSFTAETEQGEANAKTGLVGSDIVWRSGDQIQLKNSSSPSQTETLTVAEGTGTNKGKFYTSSSFNLEPPYTATYGVNIDNGVVSLPSTQTLTAANVASPGTIADGLMPMVATSSTNKLPFKNLLGGLCFKVTGSGALTAIRITSNTSEKLWGDFTANFADGTMTPTPNGTGSNVLTVNCTGVTLSNTVQYFIVMLPPGTLASGYTVDFLNGNTVVKTQSGTGSLSLVQRSKIKTSYQTTTVVPPVQYTVTTSVNNASGGTVTGGGTYNQNASCTVTATPASGYILESWTMNGLDVTWDRSYSLTVNSNVTLTANFVQVPTGALPGLFLVAGSMNNNPRRVWFSRGNLKYSGGDNGTWSFHTNQYDRLGSNGQYGSENSGIAYDIFTWSMNNQTHKGATYSIYHPYQYGYADIGGEWSAYFPNACFAYASGENCTNSFNLYDQSPAKADWGYNAISNGGNTENSGWRTLTITEWDYLLTKHTFVRMTVGGSYGSYGLVVWPDGCTLPINATWAQLEAAGALFLPAAGRRILSGGSWKGTGNQNAERWYGPSVSADNYNDYGYYWSANCGGTDWRYAQCMYFNSSTATTTSQYRMFGASVRLVKNR